MSNIAFKKIMETYLNNNQLTEDFEYNSVQINIPEFEEEQILRWTQANVPENILAESGYERNIHVTIKYGIVDITIEELKAVVSDFNVVRFSLQEMDVFRNGTYDVLHIKCKGNDLYELNKIISKNFKCVNIFPIFRPHVTLAYIIPHSCDKFVGNMQFYGYHFMIRKIILSDRKGRHHVVNLNRLG